jgi:hypothetical protein
MSVEEIFEELVGTAVEPRCASVSPINGGGRIRYRGMGVKASFRSMPQWTALLCAASSA